MGAEVFTTYARGKTAREAFQTAAEDARYEHGHGGYTGTIAEKTSYKLIPFSGGDVTSEEFAYTLIDRADSRIDDKWGPAGCIEVPPGEAETIRWAVGEGPHMYLFFGWASC